MLIGALRQRLFPRHQARAPRVPRRRPGLAVESMEPRQLLASSLLVNDPVTIEGTGGVSSMAYNVALNIASTTIVTVDYATQNYTALSGVDYTATTGTVTFAPGETSKTVLVPLVTDSLVESNEIFFLKLANVTNANLAKATSVATIKDDDVAITPVVSITNPRIAEGNSGFTPLVYSLTLNTPVLDKVISVTLSTTTGSAKPGIDYEARSGVVVNFNPGELTKTFVVNIIGDTVKEGTETIYVSLASSNVKLAVTSAVGMILNDD